MVTQRRTLTLRTSIWKTMLLLALSLGFVAIGLFIMPSGDWETWLATGFFGLCAVILVVQLLPGANFLKLDETGFTYGALFRKTHVAWRDVSPFSTGEIGGRDLVLFDVADTHRAAGSAIAASLSRSLAGASGALPDTYGLTVDELAELLNEWRTQARRGS